MKTKKGLTTFLTQTGDHGEKIELQYDHYNRLYVNGEKIVTTAKLDCFERVLAALVSFAAIGGLIVSILHLIKCC